MSIITAQKFKAFAPKAPQSLVPHLVAAADRFEINTPLRVAHWLAQLAHESGIFTVRAENLNYSAARLMAVWPTRFKTLEFAKLYERNPEKLANYVYGGRMGNVEPGSGWATAGKGFIQATGTENYQALGKVLDRDLLDDPDWLLTDEGACMSAGAFWSMRGLNRLADLDDVSAVTRRVNGGLVGLEHRNQLLTKAKGIWK